MKRVGKLERCCITLRHFQEAPLNKQSLNLFFACVAFLKGQNYFVLKA